MTESRQGQVITFYSYKGGTGRTMALANVAWILASAGKRVLIVDWDIEAPGLPKFFRPFLHVDADAARGVIDMVRRYEDEVTQPGAKPEAWIDELATVKDFVFSVEWPFEQGGSLDLLTAGRQNDDYASSLSSMDWDVFYDRLGGGLFFDALREDMRRSYDYTLIDSRTGFSDIADICTQHLPDVLVDCFTLSDQGIQGAARVAQAVSSFGREEGPGHSIRVLPVAMRVDSFEQGKREAGRALARRSFPQLPSGMSEAEREEYFAAVEVPYQPFYAYEETLAVFERPGSPGSIMSAYERLTGVITFGAVKSLPRMDNAERERWQQVFQRPLTSDRPAIVLDYRAEDQIWAEWIQSVLSRTGTLVVDPGPLELRERPGALEEEQEVLSIMSGAYLAAPLSADTFAGPAHYLFYIDDVRMGGEHRQRSSVTVAGLPSTEAARRLLRLVNVPDIALTADIPSPARFPGEAPRWLKAPAHNTRFTGRVGDLAKLRASLKSEDRTVVLPQPVALQGTGGVGKTQLAMEYVHRFGAGYDLVWWVACDPPQLIDSYLVDLGGVLKLPEQDNAVAAAHAALQALAEGNLVRRWLLVFDNADAIDTVKTFLPKNRSGGHVLITSRNPDWSKYADPVEVDVFQRAESMAHLRRRTEAITDEHADRVAEILGDLPLAVAAAGAWLAETGAPVDDFVRLIQAARGQNEDDPADDLRRAWARTWKLSLDRLESQSPAAYRLLQVLSVLNSETALDLIYSDQIGEILAKAGPRAPSRLMRGALVQQVGALVQQSNRLALLKLDPHARQVQVHRVLQAVVRDRMTEEEILETRHAVHLLLARFRPEDDPDNPVSWDRFRMIWPHLEVIRATTCQDGAVRQLMIDRVRYLWRRGDLEQGISFGERVAQTWRDLLKTEMAEADREALRLQILHLQFNIANILRDQSFFDRALSIDTEVHREQQALLGEDDPLTLMTASSVAADLRALGRYGEALEQGERINDAWLGAYGEDWPQKLSAANNLATSLRTTGEFHRALEIDEDTLNRRRLVLGPDHPYTLHSQNAVGRDLREIGDYRRSVAVLQVVVEAARGKLGPLAVTTLAAQANLAASLRSAGRAPEAAPLLEDTYEKLSRRFGEQAPDTLACRVNRSANRLIIGGDEAGALSETTAIVEAYQAWLGPTHPFTLVSRINQSAALRSAGQLDKAAEVAADVAATSLARLGTTHHFRLAAQMNDLTCRFETGASDGVLLELDELAKLMEISLGSGHPDALACRGNLALVAAQLGQEPASSLNSLESVLEELSVRLGETHPTVTALRRGDLLYRVIDPPDPF
jgi:tetratricopeptide (TPR) repeat protein